MCDGPAKVKTGKCVRCLWRTWERELLNLAEEDKGARESVSPQMARGETGNGNFAWLCMYLELCNCMTRLVLVLLALLRVPPSLFFFFKKKSLNFLSDFLV